MSFDRSWYESRSVAELNLLLAKSDCSDWGVPETMDFLNKAVRLGAPSEKQLKGFVNALSLLWNLSKAPQWVKDLISENAPNSYCWKNSTNFLAATQVVAPKMLESWFEMSCEMKGVDFLMEVFLVLPVRQRTAAEAVIEKTEGAKEQLNALLIDSLNHNRGNSDCYLWLWESVRKEFAITKKVKDIKAKAQEILDKELEEVSVLANLSVLNRILSKHTQGSVAKSQTTIRNLLNEDEVFRCLLTKNGDYSTSAEFIDFIKHAVFLDQGERQGLLVKTIRICPDARSLVESKTAVKSRSIGKITSRSSYQMKVKELKEIINVKIPANTKSIEVAREHGDLRENAEFKAAKEEQRILSSRRNSLERALDETLPTDFSDVVIADTVIPGCQITLRYDDNTVDQLTMLGIWDNDPDNKIVSYDTPLGALLMGRNVAEEIELPSGRKAIIESVGELLPEIKEMVKGEE